MSFSLHSSTENLGGGRRSTSVGSNSSSRRSWPVKSSMGLMSRNVSASPFSRNHWNESRWTATRSGRGRTSSRFAKEKRSLVAGRAGKGLLLKAGAGGTRGAPRQRHLRGDDRRTTTATCQYKRVDATKQPPTAGLRGRISQSLQSVKG